MNLVSRWPMIVLDDYSSKKHVVEEKILRIVVLIKDVVKHPGASQLLLLCQLSRCLKTYSTLLLRIKYYFKFFS